MIRDEFFEGLIKYPITERSMFNVTGKRCNILTRTICIMQCDINMNFQNLKVQKLFHCDARKYIRQMENSSIMLLTVFYTQSDICPGDNREQ